MIKKIRLVNWKSYEDSILYIDPLTILIGMNSSGKSNVIDALIFINRIAGGIGIFEAISGDAALSALRGGMDWVCRKNTKEFTIELTMEYKEIDYEYSITVETAAVKALVKEEKLFQISGNKKVKLFSTMLRDDELLNIPTYFSTGKQGKGQNFELSRTTAILYQTKTLHLKKKEISETAVHLLGLMNGIFVLNPIPDHMRGYSPLAEKLMTDGSNIAGVLAALDEPKKKEIQDRLTCYLKKIPEKDIVSVWTEYVGKFDTDAMLYCKEGWKEDTDECIVDARGMSDGTLRFLAIVTAMLISEENKLIVVEEVDNGLHPSRAENLLNMFNELGNERNIDVIITTHNPALLNVAGTPMIPFITVAHRNKNGQSELTLLEEIEKLPKLISTGSIGELAADGKIESALAEGRENE